jgi:hypothetical protein
MDDNKGIAALFFGFVIVIFGVAMGSYNAGEKDTREEFYKKCIDKNQELSYNKTVEHCKREYKQ